MKLCHFLLKKAYIYPKRILISALENCEYDSKYGAWFWQYRNQKLILVKSSNPERPKLQTKKFDIETGEDLKGE